MCWKHVACLNFLYININLSSLFSLEAFNFVFSSSNTTSAVMTKYPTNQSTSENPHHFVQQAPVTGIPINPQNPPQNYTQPPRNVPWSTGLCDCCSDVPNCKLFLSIKPLICLSSLFLFSTYFISLNFYRLPHMLVSLHHFWTNCWDRRPWINL